MSTSDPADSRHDKQTGSFLVPISKQVTSHLRRPTPPESPKSYLQYPQRVPPSNTKPLGTAPYRRSVDSFQWPTVMGGTPRVSTNRLLHRCREAGPPSSLVPGSTATLNLWTEGEKERLGRSVSAALQGYTMTSDPMEQPSPLHHNSQT